MTAERGLVRTEGVAYDARKTTNHRFGLLLRIE